MSQYHRKIQMLIFLQDNGNNLRIPHVC